MKGAFPQNVSKWLCFAIGFVGSGVLFYVKAKGIFESGDYAQTLVLISLVATAVAAILSAISLPRWQGFVGLLIAIITGYFLLFTQLYGLS